MATNAWTRLAAMTLLSAASISIHAARTAEPAWTGKAVTVRKIIQTHGEACGTPSGTDPGPYFWKLEPDKSKFVFEKYDAYVYKINLDKTTPGDPKISDPSYYLLGRNATALTTRACSNEVSLRYHAYAFAIHDIEDPGHPGQITPHALLFVPLRLDSTTPVGQADAVDLIVYSIAKDAGACVSPNLENFTRCVALVQLKELQDSGDLTGLIAALDGKIDLIRPPKFPSRYHNGVIHGTF